MHEQLSAQLVLGILSRRLRPGERLPSVRALARQLKLHPNTVSSVYNTLAERGWLKRRRGSGVYVNYLAPEPDKTVDAFARHYFAEGLAHGFSAELLIAAFAKLARESAQRRFFVVDTDLHLAHILAAEIGEALGSEIPFATERELSQIVTQNSTVLITEASLRRFPFIESLRHRVIRLNSMQDLLLGRERPAGAVLIAVVSASHSVRHWASTLLSALGYSADSVLLRDPNEPGWRDGLGVCSILAGDVLVASDLPELSHGARVIFRLVSPDFVSELRSDVKSSENDPGR